MQQEPIRLTDIHRVLLGDVRWTFALEVVLRMALIYALLLVAMRLMGKRMASQATRNELAALVSLAAAVGPAIHDPKAGLLPPVLVAAVVIGVERLVAVLSMRRPRFHAATQGRLSVLVRGGVLNLKALRRVALSRQRVMAQLRASGATNLGMIELVYLELNGSFTIVPASESKPGLSLVPPWDDEMRQSQPKAQDWLACAACGRTKPAARDGGRRTTHEERHCACCGHPHWEPAVEN